jgi:hypothetical protein
LAETAGVKLKGKYLMDILTPRGQQTVADESDAYAIWEKNFPDFKVISTPKNQPAVIDALLLKNNNLRYAVETKCRYDMTLESFEIERNYEWLITYEKIIKSAALAKDLGLPLVGFLYFVKDKCLLAKRISDPNGKIVCNMRVAETKTQTTVNGGEIIRKNAFLQMDGAKILF